MILILRIYNFNLFETFRDIKWVTTMIRIVIVIVVLRASVLAKSQFPVLSKHSLAIYVLVSYQESRFDKRSAKPYHKQFIRFISFLSINKQILENISNFIVIFTFA